MKKRYAVFLLSTVVGSVLIVNAPAAWLAPLLSKATNGNVGFADSWGTVWDGSAQVLIHRSDKEVLRVPQPIAWTLTVNSVFNQSVTVTLRSAALQAPVIVALQDKTVQVSAGQYRLPADSLNTLGSPFNTLRPSGDVSLNWSAFSTQADVQSPPAVRLNASIQSLRSSVTGAQVLGDYTVIATPKAPPATNANQQRWAVQLSTVNNVASPASLLLSGSGELGLSSAPQFELTAKAANPQAEQRLQALLNFLGRRQGDVYVLRVN